MNLEDSYEVAIARALTRLPTVHEACCTIDTAGGPSAKKYTAYYCSRESSNLAEVALELSRQFGKKVEISLAQVDCLPRTAEGAIDFVGLRLSTSTPAANSAVARTGQPNAKVSLLDGGALPSTDLSDRTLPFALHRAAQSSAQRLIFKDARGQSTAFGYSDLAHAAKRIASGLLAHDVRKKRIVIISIADQRAFLEAFWACLQIGAIPLPVAVPLQREQNEGTKLLTAWEYLDRPPVLVSRRDTSNVDELFPELSVFPVESMTTNQSVVNLDVVTDPDDLALLLMTSGSTGTPKFVMHSHRSLLAYCTGTTVFNRFAPLDVSFNWFPFDHVGGLVMSHLRDVVLGCTQIHAPTHVVLASPLRWLDWMSEHQVTVTWAPNFAFSMIAREGTHIAPHRWDLSSLRFILNGGESIVASDVTRFLNMLESHGLQRDAMHPAWGMSETSSGVLYGHCPTHPASRSDMAVSVGVPIPGILVRVVDDSAQVLPQGLHGDLEVKGASLTLGYYGNVQATSSSFTGDGWFKTGDRAVIIDDQVSIVGRSKEVIIINGHNYTCQEVEEIVADTPGVRRDAIVAVGLRAPGASSETIGILAAVADSHVSRQQEATRAMSDRLISKLLCARPFVRIADAASIPRTSIGKVRRAEVKQRLQREWCAAHPQESTAVWGRKWSGRLARLTHRHIQPNLLDLDGNALENITFLLGRRKALELLTGLVTDLDSVEVLELCNDVGPETSLALELPLPPNTDDGAIRNAIYAWEACPAGIAQAITDLQALLRTEQAHFRKSKGLLRLAVVCVAIPSRARPECHAAIQSISAWLQSAKAQSRWLQVRVWDCVERNAGCPDLPLSQVFNSPGYDLLNIWRDEKWFVPKLVPTPADPAAATRLVRGGVYLVAGGLGGIGRHLVAHMWQNYGVKLAVIGRTAPNDLPTPKRISADSWPASVLYLQADLANLASLEGACEEAEAYFGEPVRGAFHLGGTLSSEDALSQSFDSLTQALRPKVDGTLHLQRVLERRGGGFLVLFSSVLGFFGGSGMAAHATASGFQLGLSSQNVNCDLYVLAWSTWREVGQSGGRKDALVAQARGFCTLEVGEALSAFDCVMRQPPGIWLIGVDARNQYVAPWFEQAPRLISYSDSVASHALPTLDRPSVTTVPRSTEAQQLSSVRAAPHALRDVWRECLALDVIDENENFFDLGGHSLLIPKVIEGIERKMGLQLSPVDLFKYPTLSSLTLRLRDLAIDRELPTSFKQA